MSLLPLGCDFVTSLKIDRRRTYYGSTDSSIQRNSAWNMRHINYFYFCTLYTGGRADSENCIIYNTRTGLHSVFKET